MNRKHRNWITIWLIAVSALLIVTGTYAAYTSVKYAKSVAVARKEGDGVRFSSNYLDLKTSEETPQLKVLSASGKTVSVAITVCNYTQNEPDLSHVGDITYTMKIDILDVNGNPLVEPVTYTKQDGTTGSVSKNNLLQSLRVNDKSSNGEIFSENTLFGVSPTQHIYTITCTQPEYLSAISIRMTATPIRGTIDDINGKVLTARLKILTSTSQTGWTGRITDQPRVDAFNFEMSGTTEETMILSWDSSKVEISKWSLSELTVTVVPSPKENGRTEATIKVGGVGKPTSYRLQFYRTSAIPANETQEDLNGYVTLSSAAQSTK